MCVCNVRGKGNKKLEHWEKKKLKQIVKLIEEAKEYRKRVIMVNSKRRSKAIVNELERRGYDVNYFREMVIFGEEKPASYGISWNYNRR